MKAEHFFQTAVERYEILLKRSMNRKPPWTDDKVFQKHYFCNVFREDDRTTKWLRQVTNTLEKRKASWPHIIRAVAGFRWFNRIETGERLKPMLLRRGWDDSEIEPRLKGLHQIWSGAYIIMPCPGQAIHKLDGVRLCMRDLDAQHLAKEIRIEPTLQHAHQILMWYKGMGPFMAYEVITDLLHTKVLRNAPDANTWANPGPGCLRGLQWVYGERHTLKNPRTLLHMQELLRLSGANGYHWPLSWPQWDMRTVEHWLCEYDKYCRGQAGKHLKRRYHAVL